MTAIKDPEPLVRIYAADRLDSLPPAQRIDLVFDLMDDHIRAVRIQSARALADLPSDKLAAEQNGAINKVISEYTDVQTTMTDTPGDQLNLGILCTKQK